MSLIDKTYFVGILSIPHLSATEGVDSSLDNSTELLRQIAIQEPKFLKEILGDLYAEYVAHKTDAIWVTFEGKLKDATLHRSPIANYVFFNSYPDLCVSNTGVGTIASKNENGIDVTPQRLVNVWNDMVNQLTVEDGILDYLEENSSLYETDDLSLPDWYYITRYINIFGI